MRVTLKMIEEKEFKIVAKGYDPDEVDDFLDNIIDEFVAMQNELRSLKASASAAEAAPAPAQQSGPLQNAQSAQAVLITAQRVSDETIENAKHQAAEIIADAKEQAQQIISDAKTENMQLQGSLASMRSSMREYSDRVRKLIAEQQKLMDNAADLL